MGRKGQKSQMLELGLGSQALPIPENVLGTPGFVLVVPCFCSGLPRPHCSRGCWGGDGATESVNPLRSPLEPPQSGEGDAEQKMDV